MASLEDYSTEQLMFEMGRRATKQTTTPEVQRWRGLTAYEWFRAFQAQEREAVIADREATRHFEAGERDAAEHHDAKSIALRVQAVRCRLGHIVLTSSSRDKMAYADRAFEALDDVVGIVENMAS